MYNISKLFTQYIKCQDICLLIKNKIVIFVVVLLERAPPQRNPSISIQDTSVWSKVVDQQTKQQSKTKTISLLCQMFMFTWTLAKQFVTTLNI